MLMMVDPHVHFHVVPRYENPRSFQEVAFPDRGWPAVPDLSIAPELNKEQFQALADYLKAQWP